MKRLVLLLLLFVTGHHVFSQDFILDKRWKIKSKMERFYAENNREYSSSQTDSSVTYTLTDSLSLPATYIFYFNKTDRCIKQETIFTCDSCLTLSVQQSLSNKFIKWKKTGPETHYAGFPYNTSMERLSTNGQFILRYTRVKRKDLKAGAE